jgi:transposase
MRGAFARALRKVPRRRRVYVDETGANVAMTRLFGRAAPGERVGDAVPHAGWRAVTLVAAMRADGPTAALAYEGSTGAAAFEAFVARRLRPTLRKGDVVIMGRLAAHMGPAVRAAVERAGARVPYLPPYSDDPNPIEDTWSVLKQRLRSTKARTVETLIGAMGEALRAVTASDAVGFFKHRTFK